MFSGRQQLTDRGGDQGVGVADHILGCRGVQGFAEAVL
jgi:hypothetical protein